MSNYARFDVFPMVLPEMGPRSVPDKITFVANEAVELDLSQLINNGWLDYVSGVYVDNFANNGTITLICSGTNQRFVIPPNSAGYFPLLLPNPPKVILENTDNETVTFQWYNVPVFPVIISGASGGSGGLQNVNITEIGGVPVTTPLEVTSAAPIIYEYTNSMTGANQQIINAGEASNYLLIQNPMGNGPVTVNIAGGDASVTGFLLDAGGQYENNKGIANDIFVSGAMGENLIIFAG